jgi:hypothetical protein
VARTTPITRSKTIKMVVMDAMITYMG